MPREHVNILRSEIKSETATDQATYEVYRKKIIRTFMDTVEGDKRHDYDSRLIREFNQRCDQLGFDATVQINPKNAGLTYTGNFDGIPALPTGNELLNENFTGYTPQDGAEPGKYDFLIENYNGHPIGPSASSLDQVQMSGWYFHSPMFTNTTNYQSLMLAQLISKESYNLVETGQLLGYGDFMQDRVVKLFGQNDALVAPGSNSDFNSELNRLFFNFQPSITPITMIGNTVGAPGLNNFQTGYWCRYDLTFNFGQYDHAPSIPEDTTGISFGCYVKIEAGDPLKDLNFGGMYIRQITGDGGNQEDFVDVLQVKGSDFTQSASTMGTTNYARVGGTNGCYNWGNGRALEYEAPPNQFKLKETFPKIGCSVRALDTKLQTSSSASGDWVLLSGQTPYITGDLSVIPHTGINAVLFYAENHSYLDNGAGAPGAIYFAQPFVTFLS